MEVSYKHACHIHGIVYSDDSDSDLDNKTEFDEDYWLLKPPPYDYESIKDKIVVIPARTSKKINKTSLLNKNTHKQKIRKGKSNIANVSSGCSIENVAKKKARQKKTFVIQHQITQNKQTKNNTSLKNEQKSHAESNIPSISSWKSITVENVPKKRTRPKKISVTQNQIPLNEQGNKVLHVPATLKNEQKNAIVKSNISRISSWNSIENVPKKKTRRKKTSVIQHQVPEKKQKGKPVNKVSNNPSALGKTDTCLDEINTHEPKAHIVKSCIPSVSMESMPKKRKKRKKKSVKQALVSDKEQKVKKTENKAFDDPTVSKKIERRLKKVQNVWHSGYTEMVIQEELNILRKKETDMINSWVEKNKNDGKRIKTENKNKIFNTSDPLTDNSKANISIKSNETIKKLNSTENDIINVDTADYLTEYDSFTTENQTNCLFDDEFGNFIQQIICEGTDISALNAFTYEQLYNVYMNYKQRKGNVDTACDNQNKSNTEGLKQPTLSKKNIESFKGLQDKVRNMEKTTNSRVEVEENVENLSKRVVRRQMNNSYLCAAEVQVNSNSITDSFVEACNPYRSILENEDKTAILTNYDNTAVTLKKPKGVPTEIRNFYKGSPFSQNFNVSNRNHGNTAFRNSYSERSYCSKKPYFNDKNYSTIMNKRSNFEALKTELQSVCWEFGCKILEQLLVHFVLQQF